VLRKVTGYRLQVTGEEYEKYYCGEYEKGKEGDSFN